MDKNIIKAGQRGISRRAILASTVIAGTHAVAAAADSQPADENNSIERLPLGKTGIKITRLGMGASFTSYTPAVLSFAYRQGIRYFDNGVTYANGQAEMILGNWVNDMHCRSEVFIVTKVPTLDPDKFYDGVVRALEKMQLDTIDLFFIHGLSDPAALMDKKADWQRVKDRLVHEGKIRFMGFSTHAEMTK